MNWISIAEQLPADNQKVICYLPDNYQYLPGKTGETRFEPVLILRFVANFFVPESKKHIKYVLCTEVPEAGGLNGHLSSPILQE